MPNSILEGMSTLCNDVLKIFLATWGTAKPIKAIGPQNAVTAPARIPTEIIVKSRVRWIEMPRDFAYDSPIKKAFKDLDTAKANIKPINTQKDNISDWFKSVEEVLPNVQRINFFNDSASEKNCNTLIIDETNVPIITPIINNVAPCFTFLLNNSINNNTNRVPNVDANIMDMLENKEIPKIVPAKINSATPNPEPELIPKTNGPAKEFRNKDCIKTPDTESAAPSINDVIALGKRILKSITFSILSDDENSSDSITFGSIHSDPINKLRTNNTTVNPENIR